MPEYLYYNIIIISISLGMDPAGPWYDSYSIDASLNPSCASFVDVMHTHGKGGPVMNYGTLRVLGHMDFYPNEGGMQPGCVTREAQGLPFYHINTANITAYTVVCNVYCIHSFRLFLLVS